MSTDDSDADEITVAAETRLKRQCINEVIIPDSMCDEVGVSERVLQTLCVLAEEKEKIDPVLGDDPRVSTKVMKLLADLNSSQIGYRFDELEAAGLIETMYVPGSTPGDRHDIRAALLTDSGEQLIHRLDLPPVVRPDVEPETRVLAERVDELEQELTRVWSFADRIVEAVFLASEGEVDVNSVLDRDGLEKEGYALLGWRERESALAAVTAADGSAVPGKVQDTETSAENVDELVVLYDEQLPLDEDRTDADDE